MGRYSKLLGAFIGNAIAIVVVWLASKGIATCEPAITPGAEEVCSVFGFTTGQITAGAMAVLNMAFVYAFPANKPPA